MMRVFLAVLSLLFYIKINAQINESFTDGDFTSNPTWTVNSISDFSVNAGQLKSANTTSNSAFYISTTNTLSSNCTWEFWVNLQFATSSTNYVDAYLISDNTNLLASTINGYFVRIGNTSDDICLYKSNAGTQTILIDGVNSSVASSSNNLIKIKVTRTSANVFTLERDMTGTGSSYFNEGTITDASFNTSVAFGFAVKQSTASFFGKHLFDDINVGTIVLDVTPPSIINNTVVSSTQLDVLFNEALDITSAQTITNYFVNNGIGNPLSANRDGGNFSLVHLSFSTPFGNGVTNTITVNDIQDIALNTMTPTSVVFSYYKAKPYDVVINELMPDPPAVPDYLPSEEYVELKNKTQFPINLKNWSISTLSTTKKIPNITILPDSFVVLTGSGNANAFSNFNITAYEIVSFPSLLNDGTTLTITDSNGVVINSISYTTDWYNDATKKDGGWSLELIDPNNPCGGQSNWHASTHPSGGTPGRKNSVLANNPDSNAPQLERVVVINADSIILVFTEPLDSITLVNSLNYSFDNGLTNPTYIKAIGPDFKKVLLKLSGSIQLGTIYNVNVLGGVTDCVGNSLINGTAPFALPEAPSPNDVVINEVLFNEPTGGVDFVELYNRSNKTINLKDLRIGSMDTLTGILEDTEIITEEGYLLFPGSYLVLSESGNTVKQKYQTTNPKGFYDVVDLPSMNNDADVVTLSDKNMIVIDNLIYTEKMHFPLLVDVDGVSLERIDFNRPTDDRTNWNSASEGVGFATPAYRNSQYLQADGGSGVSIPNPLFSPDNDGYNDVLNISYKLNESGIAANIFIYDSKGRQVRHLVKNEQLSSDGVISWNGINDNNEKAPIGIYVVYVELFNLSGKVNKYKLSCTLAGKL